MPKIKLKPLEKYSFVYKTRIHVRDVNYGGHLGNDAIVGLTHEARIDMLEKMGFTELNIGDNETGLIMADLAVNFKEEGFLLDNIEISSQIEEISAASFRAFHKITKEGRTIALIETGLIAFNYKNKSVAEIPEQFLKKIEEFQK
ncbi:MAG: thioesterase family protein [Spirochaetes bacterium]|nr:thioesterase family protein [Spirochaetota bacterium]